jgi:hypothetical protein
VCAGIVEVVLRENKEVLFKGVGNSCGVEIVTSEKKGRGIFLI